MTFDKNIGPMEQFLRINLGVLLLLTVFMGPQTPWGLIGIIPLVTGLAQFCPINMLIRANPFKRA